MNDKLLYQATEYEQAHSRKRRWHKVVTAMAAVVVFCTTYALILPAITMSDTVYCGYEEAYAEECRAETPVLTCGLCPDGHTHTEACYETKTTLVCGLEESEEHTHSEACYETEQVLICGSEEYAPHEHTEECWSVERELICGKETHTHTLQCYSDPTADVQTPSTWERSFADMELSGEWREDVLAIAETQLGYSESAKNYLVAEDGTTKKGYTIYGDWYGDPYGDWCAMFCSFCLHYAGVDAELFPQSANCRQWVELLTDAGLYHGPRSCDPAPGDLAFFDRDGDGVADHVGFVLQVENSRVRTIEGNSGDCVTERNVYDLSDAVILGYGVLPEPHEEESGETPAAPAEETPDVKAEKVLHDGGDDLTAVANLIPGESQNLLKSAVSSVKKAFRSMAALQASGSDKYDLAQYITTVNIQHRASESDPWENISDGTVRVGDCLRFNLSYELPSGTLNTTHRTISYQVPDNIVITKADAGNVKDGSGAVIGSYMISTDGSVSITFDESYATSNANGSKVNGRIAFESSVDAINGGETGSVTFPFHIDIILTVEDPYGDIRVEKTSYDVDTFNGTLMYRIEISTNRGTGDTVTLTDTPTYVSGLSAAQSITVTDASGSSVTPISCSGNKMVLPQMQAGERYIITYDASLTSSYMSKLLSGQSVDATNKARVSSKATDGGAISWESSVKNSFSRDLIHKYGELIDDVSGGKILWTIKINTTSTTRIDLSGWRLSDDFNGQVLDPRKNVIIAPNPATGEGSITTHLPYTFPANSVITEYTVSYETDGDSSSTNSAVLTSPTGATIGTGSVTPGSASITKAAVGNELLGRDASGSILLEQSWNVTFSTNSYLVKPNQTGSVCGLSSSKRTAVFPNGGWWRLQEKLGSTGAYFTRDQIQETAGNIAQAIESSGYSGNYYIFALDSSENGIWFVARSSGSDAYFSKSPWGASKYEYNSATTYNRIYVYFDSTFGPDETLSFDVKSNYNIGQYAKAVSVSNTAYAADADFTVSMKATQSFAPTLVKYDHRKGSSSGVMPTEYAYEDTSGLLEWSIRITLPAEVDYTEPVIITDTLPEGLMILPDHCQFAGKSGIFGSSSSSLYLRENASNYKKSGFTENAANGIGTLAYNSYTMGFEFGEYVAYDGSSYPRQISLTIPANLANRLKGNTVTLYVNATFTDTNFTRRSFTNTVTESYRGSVIESESQTQTVSQKMMKKGASSVTTDENSPYFNTVPYYVGFNYHKEDLVPGTDRLTLTDTLTYTIPANGNFNAILDPASIRVYQWGYDESELSGALFSGIVQYLADPNYTVAEKEENLASLISAGELEEITPSCPYTISVNSDVAGNVSSTLRLTVPDSAQILVCYNYKLSGAGKVESFTNSASLDGVGGSESSDSSTMEVRVQESNATAVLVGINVYKVDSANYAVHLNGAEFRMERWTGSKWVEAGTFVTEGDGFFNTGALVPNTAYRLMETKAPEGYEMREATTYEFYIKDTSLGAAADCKPTGFAGLLLNNGDNISIANQLQAYELPNTGGAGTALCTLGGAALMAAALLTGAQRRRREQD